MNLRTEKLNLIHQIIKIEDEMMIYTSENGFGILHLCKILNTKRLQYL